MRVLQSIRLPADHPEMDAAFRLLAWAAVIAGAAVATALVVGVVFGS
jgi:hypothetical protein